MNTFPKTFVYYLQLSHTPSGITNTIDSINLLSSHFQTVVNKTTSQNSNNKTAASGMCVKN